MQYLMICNKLIGGSGWSYDNLEKSLGGSPHGSTTALQRILESLMISIQIIIIDLAACATIT